MRYEKTTLVVPISTVQKDATGVYAQSHDMSVARLVREAIAAYIGYDLTQEQGTTGKRGRPAKYTNDEDRKQAARRRSSERYDLIRRLKEDHQRLEREKAAAALQASLDRRALLQS